MTVIVNLISGPGCGKSTVAAKVFALLKENGYSAELVTEYVKDIVYDDNTGELKDQLLISAQQNHRLHRLEGKVDFAICDASLLNGIIYNQFYECSDDTFDALLLKCFNNYDNENFFLPRLHTYSNQGRTQTFQEAIELDCLFDYFLHDNSIPFHDFRKLDPNNVAQKIFESLTK